MSKSDETPEADLSRDVIDDVLHLVGPRLRALRRHRGVTLADLARATGISESTLSRLEAGQRRPTLELMLLLARAHHIPIDELVGAPETGDPRVRLRPLKRWGMIVIPLTRRPGGVQAYKLIIPVHPGEPPAGQTHDGYEWLYVLAGRLHLILGDRQFELGDGEAVEFDTRTPHAFVNRGPGPVEALTLFGAAGERIHLRASPNATDLTDRRSRGRLGSQP
ncbi:helix-turn-helix domain-containing protein [Rhizomonospora bruguierae]|uniref:helix-turn-helix domain-containing protein n=1 Tax=Rhizomonospora bruguierae TaxID=1581705 RepID=UPI001BCBC098|nr:helix-turn-helix transcriptional regulator [Micromonospora sp. NBRC 107566]